MHLLFFFLSHLPASLNVYGELVIPSSNVHEKIYEKNDILFLEMDQYNEDIFSIQLSFKIIQEHTISFYRVVDILFDDHNLKRNESNFTIYIHTKTLHVIILAEKTGMLELF